MADRIIVEGRIAAVVTRKYDAYTRRDGTLAQAGETRVFWLVTAQDADPIEVRVRDDVLWGRLLGMSFGDPARVECELSARSVGGRGVIERTALTIESAPAAQTQRRQAAAV